MVASTVYLWGTNNIINNARENAEDILDQVNVNIKQITDTVENMALSIAINREIIFNLTYKDMLIDLASRNQVTQKIEDVLFANSNIVQMILLETPNAIVFSKTASMPVPSHLLRIQGSVCESEVRSKRGSSLWFGSRDSLISSSSENTTGNAKYIRCSAMLMNTAKTDACGFLSIFLRVKALESAITGPYESLENSSLVVMDKNREVILSNNNLYNRYYSDLFSNINGDSGFDIKKIENENILLTYKKNASTDWYVVSLIPQISLTRSLRGNMKTLWVGAICLILICIFLSYSITNKIIHMLDPLLSTMKSVKEGNLTARVPEDFVNELAIVGQVFNQTLDSYEELLKENYRKENLLTVARLNALQGQLSPHFISNTLDSINWTLIERQQYDISDALGKLASLLRYSISGTNDMVALSEELNAIECYLDICKVRFEDKLIYKIHIDSSLNNMMIPRFLLQPLVENSIVHGIEKRKNNGQIIIKAYNDIKYTIIEIIDNGPGFSEEIKALTEIRNLWGKNRKNIGLTNVLERFYLIYGSGYKIEFLDAVPEGARIRILLPLFDNKK
ncbi:MAG TPA: histidine kinase [Clostridiaceae bacterium]|nr:histidine kinase [Clostridiaceae bacterium]